MKAPIQTDVAECILQIAVFEPGRALLESSPAMMDALRALATDGRALTSAGQLSAQHALVAIEGVASHDRGLSAELVATHETGEHVMLSYQVTRFHQLAVNCVQLL